MKHVYLKPHQSLTDYVRTVLVIDGSQEPDPSSQALVTNGMSALFCKNNKLTLYMKTVPAKEWTIDNRTKITCYFFKPFAATSIFNIDAKKLAAQPLEIQKNENGSIDDLLISLLHKNKKQCEVVRYATDQMMIDNSKDVLANIQIHLGINERTFQRIFKKFVGVTPVQYRRICQFETSFTQLRTSEFSSLSDIAYNNGFADQSHFIRAFKEFTETTPNNYLRSGLKKEN